MPEAWLTGPELRAAYSISRSTLARWHRAGLVERREAGPGRGVRWRVLSPAEQAARRRMRGGRQNEYGEYID